MKGDIVFALLSAIGESASTATDVIFAMLDASHGASAGKLDRQFHTIQHARMTADAQREEQFKIRQRYHHILYHLKQDGLIVERSDGDKKRNRVLALTKKGFYKLGLLRTKASARLPAAAYPHKKNDRFTICAFDIPERDRKKRNWLRAVLQRLGFAAIQKSVFIGKVRVPKELIDDMKALRILDYVEIFEISKTGSLRHIA